MIKKLTKAQKQLRNKWVKALKSGKYNQTREMLRSEEGFCCLGVLCDIVDKKGWLELDTCSPFEDFAFHNKSITTELPRSVRKAVGLTPTEMEILMDLNDGDGLDFKQIAKVIESGKISHP